MDLSRRNLDVFSPSQFFFGGGASNSYTHFITPALGASSGKKFCEVQGTPTSPVVIGPNTLNFKPNFKFSRLFYFFFGGGNQSLEGCALAGLG